MTTTTCSGCSTTITLDAEFGTAQATIPSNGRRGSLHVPTHKVTSDVFVEFHDGQPVLLTWDCPVPECGYADSYDLTQ